VFPAKPLRNDKAALCELKGLKSIDLGYGFHPVDRESVKYFFSFFDDK
jgi:hypothetical protein